MVHWIYEKFRDVFFDKEKEKLLPTKRNEKIPMNDVGYLSYVFVSWMTPFMWRNIKDSNQSLKEEDIWECSDLESASLNTERLSEEWEHELKNKGPAKASLLRVWFRFIRARLLILFAAVLLLAVVGFIASCFITDRMVKYLLSTDQSIYFGLFLVVLMGIGQIGRAVSYNFIFIYGAQTGVRIRAGMLGLAYTKLLKLKQLKGSESAEVVTIFGADAQRIYNCCITVVFFLALLSFLIISGIFLYYLIGLWCFLSIGIFIAFFLLQVFFTSVTGRLRKSCLIFTDQRIRKTAEVIKNMKFIKMYAWEDAFMKRLKQIRKGEEWYLMLSALVFSLSNSFTSVSPVLASVITIVCMRSTGYQVEISWVFSMLAVMYYMRFTVALIPKSARDFGEAKVSFTRITNLLIKEEFVAPCADCFNSTNAIEIDRGCFLWDGDGKQDKGRRQQSTFTLDNVDMSIPKGTLIGICGPVGCGKSSLLAALLGRITKVSGHLALSGSVAYAAQQAWIFNGTLRENITFGNRFDLVWYKMVIHVCGLEPDVEKLNNSDLTEIGEYGVNLSGGQKQRVSLARAVYSKSDIYLLDDPLSAVDIHVGDHLFHECIKKTLKQRTVILVTHQLQYLSDCDYIFVMENGNIKQHGNHESLMSRVGYYRNTINTFDSSSIASQITGEQVTGGQPQNDIIDAAPNNQNLQKNKENNIKLGLKQHGNTTTIIKEEESKTANVKWKTYKYYIDAAGGTCVAIFVLLCYTLCQSCSIFSTTWISVWVSSLNKDFQLNHGHKESINSSQPNITNYDCKEKQTLEFTYIDRNASDALITIGTENVWDMYFIVLFASLGGIIVLGFITACVSAKVYITACTTIHNKSLSKVMEAPMEFFDSNPSGRIINRFSRDLDEGDVYVPMFLGNSLVLINTIIISTLVSSVTLPWIWIAVLPIFSLLFFMKRVFFTPLRQLRRFINVAISPLLSHINKTGEGLTTIVTMKRKQQFNSNCLKLIDVTSSGLCLFTSSMHWVILRIDILASIISVVTCLIMVLTKGQADPALSVLSLTLVLSALPLVQMFIRIFNEFETRFTSIERIQEYEMDLKTEGYTNEVILDKSWPKDGHILLSDIEMSYRPDLEPVLRNIRFEINSGEKIGIIGRTGAGKSSLVTSLFRLVELTNGHIYIDGVDIAEVFLNRVRSNLSVIPQDPVLFTGTIRFNLDPFQTFGDQAIWTALEQAHMKDKVQQLKDKLNHFVEESGMNFSVGERQLLCLSRVILRRNKILILDEATSSVDTATDAMIQNTIRSNFTDCTLITIAHRLNTVLQCDKILVMDAGQIVEIGSPHDLLSNPHSFFNSMQYD